MIRSVGSIADRGTGMQWVLRLIATEGDARCLSTDLIEICRPEGLGDIADLGLTLPEAKQLLASVQRAVIAAQADSPGHAEREALRVRQQALNEDRAPAVLRLSHQYAAISRGVSDKRLFYGLRVAGGKV